MRVLSLFDGMSGGRIALDRAGIPVEKYFACEIDKYAIQVSKKNYPDIEHLGDVRSLFVGGLGKIDLLIAGFPCQAWSLAGKQKGDNDPRGALVHDLIKIWSQLKRINPDLKFMFENVKMKKEFVDYINDLFGVEPIEINSCLVSAQGRKRLYWTNIEGIEQPKDKGIHLKSIIGTGVTMVHNIYGGFKETKVRVFTEKSPTIRAACGGGHLPSVFKGYKKEALTWALEAVRDNSRKVTPLECERLQTLPDGYTDGVSNTQRYKMIGNGWTVDVIAHILKHMES